MVIPCHISYHVCHVCIEDLCDLKKVGWWRIRMELKTSLHMFSWDDFVNGKSEFYLWVSKRNFISYYTRKWDDVFQKIDNEDTSGQVSIS